MCLSRKLVWCTVKVTLNSATITYSSSYLDESFEKLILLMIDRFSSTLAL